MKRLLLIILSAALLFSCTDGLDDARPKASLETSQTVLDAAGGAVFIRVKAEGDWSLQLTEGGEWAALGTLSGRGDRNNVMLSFSANPEETPRQLAMELVCGKVSAFLALSQAGSVATPETPGMPTGYGSPIASAHWLELPATDASDGVDFFSRDCTLGGKKMRNYAFYWDYSSRVSLWVAYPLCSAYMGSSGRSEAWGYDPLLPASRQQNVSGGYQESGTYARGHQIPSADRTADYSLNSTTFYGTNMTPQRHTLNEGVWATLEGKVRDWAKQSDTLYVVTGCVVTGSTTLAHDRSGNAITVPTAYFKALLRYQKNSTVGYGGYMGAGFWYDHEGFPSTFSSSQAMSLNELEAKLGYALFVNLQELVGADNAASIKAEKPATNTWWWK